MGISGAVGWWEEWQLRILVLASLFVQWLLFLSASQRKRAIPFWFRSSIWLSYLGSDALAIYALATLFSRQRKHGYTPAQSNGTLEVVWAPVLLMHLGGQDCITAYNIEDNELWRRHVLTSVSQVTVAIYVFCKSWPGDDKRLLQAAILFFIPGILKCLEKPWALKSASINSLASSSDPAPSMTTRVGKHTSLEQYVQEIRTFVHHHKAQQEGDTVDLEVNNVPQSQGEGGVSLELDPNPYPQTTRRSLSQLRQEKANFIRKELEVHKLFVDLASPYPHWLDVIKSFWVLDEIRAYFTLCLEMSKTFDLLYTRSKITSGVYNEDIFGSFRSVAICFPFAAIGLFHWSHREAYKANDVRVTYALFCCTAVLELFSFLPKDTLRLSGLVGQYNLVGFFARNKRHAKKMWIVSFFKCKDFLDQHWCIKSCPSARRITRLVLKHLKKLWQEHIVDAVSYRRFSDYRGLWTIQRTGCDHLEWSLNRPFDESVLLWHIATDLCFYQKCDPSIRHQKATECREVSNYMIYLLFINPEMLLSGTRRNLFMEANTELEKILMDDKPSLKAILKGDKPSLQDILKGKKSFIQFLKGKNPSPKEIERGVMERIIDKLQPTECRGEVEHTESPLDPESGATAQEGCIIRDAWKISKALVALGDEKMWEVIEGVWVEMICFSASRCPGYLHVKSMSSGMELLTYVWFLMSRMGMETLPERLQRTELSTGGGNTSAAPSTS